MKPPGGAVDEAPGGAVGWAQIAAGEARSACLRLTFVWIDTAFDFPISGHCNVSLNSAILRSCGIGSFRH